MAQQPQVVSFTAKKNQAPELRVAEALEFIAERMAAIEHDLALIRADIRAVASRQPQP